MSTVRLIDTQKVAGNTVKLYTVQGQSVIVITNRHNSTRVYDRDMIRHPLYEEQRIISLIEALA